MLNVLFTINIYVSVKNSSAEGTCFYKRGWDDPRGQDHPPPLTHILHPPTVYGMTVFTDSIIGLLTYHKVV